MPDEPEPPNKLFAFVYGALAATLYVVSGWRLFKDPRSARPLLEPAIPNDQPAERLDTNTNIEEDATENADVALATTEEVDGTKDEESGLSTEADTDLPPGWHKPQPEKLPQPTYWPAVFAFAMVLFAWGWVTDMYISVIGLVLFVIALAGWIGDLRHESKT